MSQILQPNDIGSFVVAATGARGSGKSLLLTALAVQVMIQRNKQVWSNMPIAWDCVKNGPVPGGPRKGRWESKPLDLDALAAFDTSEMEGGWIIWDEIQNNVDSRRPMSLGNILYSKVMAQIRKRDLSVAYSVQDLSMIDTRMRWQTDLEFACTDLFVRGVVEDEEKPTERGVVIGFARRNLSGYLPGQIYSQTGHQRMGKFYGKRYWSCYDSKQAQSPLDSMVPYRLALGEKVISAGQPTKKVDPTPALKEYIDKLRNTGKTSLTVEEFWEGAGQAGINMTPKQGGQYAKSLGVIWKYNRTGTNTYEIKPLNNDSIKDKIKRQLDSGKTAMEIMREMETANG
jgi:hypothetical protein